MRVAVIFFLAAAATTLAILPGDFLVASPARVATDAEEGIWFLAPSPAGNLYLVEKRALGNLPAARILHDDPETASYLLVTDYGRAGAGAYAPYGNVVPLGEATFLLITVRGREGELYRAGLRAEFVQLRPARFVERSLQEEPLPEYNKFIDEALKKIKQDLVRDYITTLQEFGTRYSYTLGFQEAAEYVHDFFADLGYHVSYDNFFGVTFDGIAMPTDGTKVWLVTYGGTIYRSDDRGGHWQQQNSPARGFLWSVIFLDENVGHAVGAGGTALVTTNGGATWTRQNVPYAGYLFGVSFADANNGWIVGDQGRIFRTTDGGATWTQLTSPTGVRLYDVAMADATHGWACGRDGVILRTTDGTTWTTQNSTTTQYLYGIYAVSADEAWACGLGKTLLHTTDGGATWNRIELTQPTWANFYDVQFTDANHGYVVGRAGAFLYTTDGGQTWSYKRICEEDLQCCDFATASFGMVGGDAALLRTNDGGATFTDLTGNFEDVWRNVVAEKKGVKRPDEIVIVCGHLDCTSEDPLVNAPGAEDNGSGSAATMAAAFALADMDFERTLRFIVWGGEEQGLVGSWHYAQNAAANGENIVAVVNMDMVGYDEENGQRDDSTNCANDPSRWLAEYLAKAGEVYGIDHHFDVIIDPYAAGSDHYSFWVAGYDAIFLIEGEVGVGGITKYPWYHTTQDTVDKLHMRIEVAVARAATATAAHIARHYLLPTVATPAPPGGEKPFAVYPNPLRLGGSVHFQGVRPGARVEIYDLAGRRLVAREVGAGEDEFVWFGRSDAGSPVAPGVYFYRVFGAGMDECGKLAILR